MLRPRGDVERPTFGELERGNDGLITDAVKLLPFLDVGSTERCAADLDEILAPGRRAPPPGEDIGHPDAVAGRPSALPWPQDPDGNVAGPLAQPAVLEDQRQDADGAQPERDPEHGQDGPDHDVVVPGSTSGVISVPLFSV